VKNRKFSAFYGKCLLGKVPCKKNAFFFQTPKKPGIGCPSSGRWDLRPLRFWQGSGRSSPGFIGYSQEADGFSAQEWAGPVLAGILAGYPRAFGCPVAPELVLGMDPDMEKGFGTPLHGSSAEMKGLRSVQTEKRRLVGGVLERKYEDWD
jgi:hypothetical protein